MIRPVALLFLAVSLAAPLHAADPAPPAAAAATVAAATVAAPKNISVDDAEKLLKSDSKVIVLDVRTADEFKDGHIPGAKNVDFFSDDFAKQVAALDKSKTYVVHCAAGGRSAKACKVFEKEQLPSVYHLNEGFKAWEAAGKPVEK
ncbi:MAG TPA: rhodanese-like domain-containing protein [Chthoniobacter sp.]|nr:rhodanese-like domain-containing protein [Chthoniobacter sp.]